MQNNLAHCAHLQSLPQIPCVQFWSCYDKGCIWLVSKYPDAEGKSHSVRLFHASATQLPALDAPSWLSAVIRLHLDVWHCVATTKDEVRSFTAVKVTPFFFLLTLHRNKLHLQDNFGIKLYNWCYKPRKWESCLEKEGKALWKQGLQENTGGRSWKS